MEIISSKSKLLPFQVYSPKEMMDCLLLDELNDISVNIIQWFLDHLVLKSKGIKKSIKDMNYIEIHNLFFDECQERKHLFVLYCDIDTEFEEMMIEFFKRNYGNEYRYDFDECRIPFNEIEWKDLSILYKVTLIY